MGDGSIERQEYVGRGRYEIAARPNCAGRFEVGVYVRGQHVIGSPYTAAVSSGQTFPQMSFAVGAGWKPQVPIHSFLTFDIHARDREGNPQSRPQPTDFLVTLAPRVRGSTYTRLHVVRREGAVTTYAFRVPREGPYELAATLEGIHIMRSPFHIQGVKARKTA